MDRKLAARRATQDSQRLINAALSGDSSSFRPGAEAAGIEVLKCLLQEYVMGSSALAEALRRFVAGLCDRTDPLRRDIPAEHWAALWPVFNTITTAREDHERRAAGHDGAGVVGAVHPGGEGASAKAPEGDPR